MNYPEKKSQIKRDLYEYNWLIYGQPKVGKTTFAAEFNDPLFICTENRHKHLNIYKMPAEGCYSDWSQLKDIFRKIIQDTKSGKFKWKTVVIDTIDNAYKFCREYTNKKLNISHESEAAWGKGYEEIKTEFFRVFSALTSLDIGIVFISHSKEKFLKDEVVELTKTTPSLDDKGQAVINPLVDIIGYIGFNPDKEKREQRLLYLQGTKTLDAGCATDVVMPAKIDLNYEAILKQFNKKEIKKEIKNA